MSYKESYAVYLFLSCDSQRLIRLCSQHSVLQLAPSHFCNWHFHNLNASLIIIFAFNPLILSGSNEYV